MENKEDVLEVEPPPPYCELNEGYDHSENTPCPSTLEEAASYHQHPPQNQSIQYAYTPRQQEILVQDEPPDYHQSQLKYFQQRDLLSQHNNQEVFDPVIQDQLSSAASHHFCPDGFYPQHVVREHPNHPLQLRFPFAVVSNQPPVLPIENPNTLDTEELLDRDDPIDKYVFAWVACLLCCWPIGIPAIITSKKARDASSRGEYQLSYRYSKLSGQLSWCAIVIGFFFYLAVVVITLRVLKMI